MVRIFAFVSSTRLIYATLSLKLKISKIIYIYIYVCVCVCVCVCVYMYIYIYISFSERFLLFLTLVNGTYIHFVYPKQNPKSPSLVHFTNEISHLSLIPHSPILTRESRYLLLLY